MSPDNQYQKNLGKGMVAVAWLILLGLLTLLFSSYLEQEDNPNRNIKPAGSTDRQQVVVLKMNRSGHYLAPGKINQTPVRFLLDTGATDVAIPEKLAKQLNLKKGARTMSQTANGLVRSHSTMLDRVSLGSIELFDIKASIFPGMPGGEVLLGMSFLKHLEMVQKDNTLTLRN